MMGAIVLLAGSGVARAYSASDLTVDAGFDLLTTNTSGTFFQGFNFMGVPIGTYNFGSGPVFTGSTDTIAQRLDPATAVAGGSATIGLQLLGLQLESTTQVNGQNLFITLDPTAPQQSGATISFDRSATPTNQFGTFTSFFDIFVDVHIGSLNGPLVEPPVQLNLASAGAPWTHQAPTGALLIDGVNNNLNGMSNSNDFWGGVEPNGVVVPIIHVDQSGSGDQHSVDPTGAIPEPGSLVIAVTGMLGLLGWGWLRSWKRTA